MKTKAIRERNLTATANSRTITMRDVRTFDGEYSAIEQLEAWRMEMEANGWSIKKFDGFTFLMTKINDRNIPQYAKLYTEFI